MGSGPSSSSLQENPKFNLMLHDFTKSGQYMYCWNYATFLRRAFIAILFTLSVQQPVTYNECIKILKVCAIKAFKVYITFDRLMILLRFKEDISRLRGNLCFTRVMKACLKHLNFPKGVGPYFLSDENLEIFFQELKQFFNAELKDINFFSQYVTDVQKDNSLIDPFTFHHNSYQKIADENFALPIDLSNRLSILEYKINEYNGFLQVFFSNLKYTIKVIGFQSYVNQRFTTPEWFVENIDEQSKNMLTNAVSRMVDNWVLGGCPEYK
jgi:hypothetical protein